MAIGWGKIVRQVASRVNAVAGSQSATAETNYTNASFGSSQTDSARFNYSLIADACLSANGRIAEAIANTKRHSYRRELQDTVTVTNGTLIPVVGGTSGYPVLGQYGDVKSGSVLMMPVSEQEIARYQRRTSSNYTMGTHYLYYISDTGWFYSTQASGTMEVCVYSDAAERALLGSGSDISLPDSLQDLIVAGAVTQLVKDTEYIDQASYYANYFAAGLAALLQGATTLPAPLSKIPHGSEVK